MLLSARLLAAALMLLPALAFSQTLPPPAHRQLARAILEELVEINTVRDSGATQAATALATRLTGAGFPPEDVQLVGPKPHKQNLVVRLRGRGKHKPILFLAHLDVVEARREDWSLDPFTLTERDGYFYGRGTMDIKDEVADLVANLLRLKAENYVPNRDIVVALTDDEETGDDNGVSWLLQHRPELIRADYVINTDAGGGQMEHGRRLRNPVQTSEKIYATYLLEVTGPGGHSSLPPKDNTIYTLAQGLDRLSRFAFPVRLNRTTRAFFRQLSRQEKGQVASDLRAVSGDSPDPGAAERLAAVPLYNSSMRNTCVATMVHAGHAENALPQRAQATIQCRLLPGDSPEETRTTLARVLADTLIRVTLPDKPEIAPASPLSPEVMTAVERVTAGMWPGVVVLPVMDPWSTDGARLRKAGVPVYGLSGIFFDINDIRAHGKDERIGVQAFYEGVEFMYRLMKDLTGGKDGKVGKVGKVGKDPQTRTSSRESDSDEGLTPAASDAQSRSLASLGMRSSLLSLPVPPVPPVPPVFPALPVTAVTTASWLRIYNRQWDPNGGIMEFRESLVRAGLCVVLFALPACGGERKQSGEQSSGAAGDSVPRLESAAALRARAEIVGPPGSGIKGEVTFVQLKGNLPEPGVEIEARITGPADRLTAGPHGLHIHEIGKGACAPPYEAAQGHFDPGPSGNPDPDVNHPFHLGDIPNLVVDQNGVGVVKATTSRITLSPGPLSLFDENGSAIIVHADADQGIPGAAKSGVSGGPRIACGVIELTPEGTR